MRNTLRTSALAAILAVAVSFPGCSSDDDEPGALDAGRDSAADTARRDATAEAEAAVTEAGSAAEAAVEAATSPDTGADAGTDARAPDAGADVRVDATAEAAADAGADRAAPDAGPDAATDATLPDAGARDAEAGARDAEAGASEAAADAGTTDAEAGALDGAADGQGDGALLDAASDATVASTVVVNEINTAGADFVELFNNGTVAVDVSGWTLSDNMPAGNGRPYTIANGTSIAAGGFLTLSGSPDGGFTFGLGDPDSVFLRDDEGRLVATHAWTTTRDTDSRCPNGTGAFSNGRAATPGATNDCSQ